MLADFIVGADILKYKRTELYQGIINQDDLMIYNISTNLFAYKFLIILKRFYKIKKLNWQEMIIPIIQMPR